MDFESICSLEIPSVLAIFRSLEATGLKRFVGGATAIHEDAIREFFKNAKMVGDSVQSSINGSNVSISEAIFSQFFKLPSKGLTLFNVVSASDIAEMQGIFSADALPIPLFGKNKLMKVE